MRDLRELRKELNKRGYEISVGLRDPREGDMYWNVYKGRRPGRVGFIELSRENNEHELVITDERAFNELSETLPGIMIWDWFHTEKGIEKIEDAPVVAIDIYFDPLSSYVETRFYRTYDEREKWDRAHPKAQTPDLVFNSIRIWIETK